MFTKDTFRLIKRTIKRFITLLLMVLIGSGFMVGLMSSSPMLEESVDVYNDEYNLMDVQIYSSFGFCDEDLKVIANVKGVKEVEGSKFVDAYGKTDDSSQFVVRVSEIDTDINKFELIEGRMPTNPNEALVLHGSQLGGRVDIGSFVEVYNDDEIEDNLKNTKYTVVGKVKSPQYLARTQETSTFKNLMLGTVLFVDNSNFVADYYTTVYLTIEDAKEEVSYSKKYDNVIDTVMPEIEKMANVQENYLKNDILKDVNEEIADAEKTLNEERADAEKEIANAERKLSDAYYTLLDGQRKIDDGSKEIADNTKLLAENKQKLEDSKKELANGWKEYNDGLDRVNDGIAKVEEGFEMSFDEAYRIINEADSSAKNIEDNLKFVDDYSNLKNKLIELADNIPEDTSSMTLPLEEDEFTSSIDEIITQTNEINNELDIIQKSLASDGFKYLLKMMEEQDPNNTGQISILFLGLEQTIKDLKMLNNSLIIDATAIKETYLNYGVSEEFKNSAIQMTIKYSTSIDGILNQTIFTDDSIMALKQSLIGMQEAISSNVSDLNELYNGRIGLEKSLETLNNAQKQINDGERQISDGEKQLANARNELEEAKVDLKEGWAEYYDGVEEIKDAKKELADKVADAEVDIAKAKQDILDLPDAKWTILKRNETFSGTLYSGTIDQMASIGNVFPLLFFLVAALVCLTTMTRLIDEERGQIGIFSALGFSRQKIISKYLIYAFCASIVGSLIGIPIGMAIYPTIIYNTWGLMYVLPSMKMVMPIHIFFLGTLSFTLLMMLVTYVVASDLLKSKPAELMRPKAPKKGKKIFLEKISFIWKNLSFITKINARNIFRYKSRFLMTVIGVAGCTSLLVLGFGIKDSISDIIDIQYSEIFNYNETITLEDKDDSQEIIDELKSDSNVDAAVEFMEYSSKVYLDNEPIITVNVFDENEIKRVVNLRSRNGHEEYNIANDGVIISEKFARLHNISVGDSITIESLNGIKKDVKVEAICEIYFQHYLFMSENTYQQLFNERVENDKIAVIANDSKQLMNDYEGREEIVSIVNFDSVIDNFQTMIGALDLIILVIIFAAGSLALVVLINLSEVNISERIREIATFKVLGFYDYEVNSYIFKEILFLTLLGAIFGMPLGKLELGFVMKIIDMDMIMFGENISLLSYTYAFLITIGFTIIVLIIMSRSLKRVKMVESLKSVE